MIEQNGDTFEVACDFCSTDIEIDTADGEWNDMMEEFRQLGWKSFKDDGEWKHKCPDCCMKAEPDFWSRRAAQKRLNQGENHAGE